MRKSRVRDIVFFSILILIVVGIVLAIVFGIDWNKGQDENVEGIKPAIEVTLSINCSSIYSHLDDLDPAFDKEKLLPKDGVILAEQTYTCREGDSVYSLLERVAKENNIPIDSDNGAAGHYVKGIAHIYEKMCGETSGWTYKVNGKLPSKSIDYYKLSADDRVEIVYSCVPSDVR